MYWCADSKETTNHGHFNIDVSNYLPDSGSLVLKFKVRTDDVSSSIRPVLQVRPFDYHNASSITGKDGNPLVYKADMYNLTRLGGISSSAGYVAGLGLFSDMVSYRADEFVEVAYVFTRTNKTDAVCYAYYGGSTTPSVTFTMQSNYGYDTRPCYFRFQVQNSSGLSWDMYDLKLYMLTTTDRSVALSAQIPDSNRGALSCGKRS